MEHKELFKSPMRTVELINLQANAPENIKFAQKYFPRFTNASEIWDVIKPITEFKADPPTVDTIQGIATLFSNTKNIHKVSGQGDCDCFVSALASIAIANNLPFEYIIQGNNKPSHIAIKIGGVILDLTNPIPDYLRQYNFTKYINPMYVALADGNELAMEANDFGRRPNFRRAISTVKKYNPAAVAVRTAAKYSPQAIAVKTANRITGRAQAKAMQYLPPAARAKIMLAKRQLKRQGFGDSEAEFLAIQNFSDDFGRPRISLKRGIQNVKKAGGAVAKVAMKAAPILLPVAGAALNLVAPTAGTKVAGIASKALQRVGGAKTLTAGRALVQNFRPPTPTVQNFAPSASIAPATLPNIPTAGDVVTMSMQQPPVFSPDTYVTAPVPINAPKINPMLLIGGGALAIFLLTRKK